MLDANTFRLFGSQIPQSASTSQELQCVATCIDDCLHWHLQGMRVAGCVDKTPHFPYTLGRDDVYSIKRFFKAGEYFELNLVYPRREKPCQLFN